jgi:IS5 family transposase
MKQQTLAVAADQGEGFEPYRKQTKRDAFLATMEQIVPWQALCSVIEPHYPKAGNGRPPIGLEPMLRMYFVQHWFSLADEACEEALLESTALRRFVGIDLGCERVPDGTTLLKFRRLLEKHKLGEALFAQVGQELQARGMKVGTGTIVDARVGGCGASSPRCRTTARIPPTNSPICTASAGRSSWGSGRTCSPCRRVSRCCAANSPCWCVGAVRRADRLHAAAALDARDGGSRQGQSPAHTSQPADGHSIWKGLTCTPASAFRFPEVTPVEGAQRRRADANIQHRAFFQKLVRSWYEHKNEKNPLLFE